MSYSEKRKKKFIRNHYDQPDDDKNVFSSIANMAKKIINGLAADFHISFFFQHFCLLFCRDFPQSHHVYRCAADFHSGPGSGNCFRCFIIARQIFTSMPHLFTGIKIERINKLHTYLNMILQCFICISSKSSLLQSDAL